MIKEAIAYIEQLANRAVEIETKALGVRQTILVVNGKKEILDTPPPIRQHRVETLEDLALLTERFADINAEDAKPVIFIGNTDITSMLDPRDRWDGVTMQLRVSPQSKLISQAHNEGGFSQKAMIRALRLKRFGEVTPNILPLLERVEWNAGSQTDGVVTHGKSSMGRKIQEECKTADVQLPEEVVCRIPMFANGSLAWVQEVIPCQLFINHETQTFQIAPMEGEMPAAFQRACDQIRNNLASLVSDNADIVIGDP